jgi:hypothetical protein
MLTAAQRVLRDNATAHRMPYVSSMTNSVAMCARLFVPTFGDDAAAGFYSP